MPNVSIIIPTFNRLWSLPKAVESCLHDQCRTEVIVVDDGSTDGTWEWLQGQNDVRSIRQANLGKCWAANRGVDAATGEYVRFLDSDDWCLEGANDAQFALGRRDNADVVVAGCTVFSEREEVIRQEPWVPCDDFIAQQLGECSSSHYSAYLFRRDFIKTVPHRQDFAFRDDRLFVLETALLNPKVTVYAAPAFGHRHHGQERLQFPNGMRMVVTNYQHLAIYRRILGRLEARGDLTPRRRRAAVKILWPLAHWIAYTHPEEGAQVADWIRQLDPEFIPPDPGWLGKLYRGLGFRKTEAILRLRRTLVRHL